MADSRTVVRPLPPICTLIMILKMVSWLLLFCGIVIGALSQKNFGSSSSYPQLNTHALGVAYFVLCTFPLIILFVWIVIAFLKDMKECKQTDFILHFLAGVCIIVGCFIFIGAAIEIEEHNRPIEGWRETDKIYKQDLRYTSIVLSFVSGILIIATAFRIRSTIVVIQVLA